MTEAEARKVNFIDSEMQDRYYRNGEKFTVEDVEYAYDSGVADGRKEGFDEGYKKATERAYERQQDLTDTYIKDGEKIKQLEKENEELKETVSRAGYRIAELKHEIDELKALHESNQKAIETITKQDNEPYYPSVIDEWR